MKIGIICGYGIVMDKRLQCYLDEVLRQTQAHRLAALILCGGTTVPGVRITEAGVMRDWFQTHAPDLPIFLEEQSITTLHNLLYAKDMLTEMSLAGEPLYIFCDAVRFVKVWCLSKILFRSCQATIVVVARKEPVFMYLLQLPFTIVQCAGAISPTCAGILRRCRQRWHKMGSKN